MSKSSERFGNCEWLTAADADGFLDKSKLTVQRTGAGSCMMKHAGPCKHVAIPALGSEAFVSGPSPARAETVNETRSRTKRRMAQQSTRRIRTASVRPTDAKRIFVRVVSATRR